MLKWIYELAKANKVIINLSCGPDGSLGVNVYGRSNDFVIIRSELG